MEKTKENKKRKYTISTFPGTINTPFIRISGRWLIENGFDIGNQLEVIEGKNMIILIKKPNYQVQEETINYQISKLQKELKQLKNH